MKFYINIFNGIIIPKLVTIATAAVAATVLLSLSARFIGHVCLMSRNLARQLIADKVGHCAVSWLYLLCSVPVQSVALFVGNHFSPRDVAARGDDVTDVTVIEDQPTPVRCVTLGGYPPPRVELHISVDDLTDRMLVVRSVGVSGQRGLRVMVEQVELSTYNFTTTRSSDGRTMNCVAMVTGFQPVVTSHRLNVMCECCSSVNLSLRINQRVTPEITITESKKTLC